MEPAAPVVNVLQLSGVDRVLPIQDGDGRPWLSSREPAVAFLRGRCPVDAGRATHRGRGEGRDPILPPRRNVLSVREPLRRLPVRGGPR